MTLCPQTDSWSKISEQMASKRHSFFISLPFAYAFFIPDRAKILSMVLILEQFAMHVLEVFFFVGMAGSAIVVLISFVEDGKELFGSD